MTDTIYADHELVALYSEEFAEQYKNAKSIASLAPKGCLTDLRILIERLIYTLAESYQVPRDKKSLHVTIEKLRATNLVTPALLDLIDEIRKPANKALHHDPEYLSQESGFEESAQRCLKTFCEVIALYRLSIQGKTDNKFKMVPDEKGDLMQLCYKAMFEDCTVARYQMTRVLGEHLYSWRRGEGNYALQRVMYLELLEICSENDGTVMAVHDYSQLKLYADRILNVDCDPEPQAILERILSLAERNPDAFEVKALFGRAALVDGLWGELQRWKRDIAWEFLESSADACIPLALTSLAFLYSRGKHIEADTDKAIQYLKKFCRT